MSARAIHRFGQIRRGKIDANAKSSGPEAALFENGSHRSTSSQPGSACQKTPSRMGSASEIVASEASNNDPSSAEPWNDRLNATSMANASVPNCIIRNTSTPVACVPRRHSSTPAVSGRAAVKVTVSFHLENEWSRWVELQRHPLPVGEAEENLPVGAEEAIAVAHAGASGKGSGSRSDTVTLPLSNCGTNPRGATRRMSQVTSSER